MGKSDIKNRCEPCHNSPVPHDSADSQQTLRIIFLEAEGFLSAP